MPTATQLLSPIGILLLLHSAYSCLHYRSILSTTTSFSEEELLTHGYSINNAPIDVIIECIIGWTLCLVGQLWVSGPYAPIVVGGRGGKAGGTTSLVAPNFVSRDFDLFNTREQIVAKFQSS